MSRRLPKPNRNAEPLITLSRPMPVDVGAQKMILAGYFYCEELLDKSLPEEYFYPLGGPDHTLYLLMKEMRSQRRPVEYMAVLGRLADKGLMLKAGGDGHVADVFQTFSGKETYDYYAGILHEKHVQRTAITAGCDLVEAAYLPELEDLGLVASAKLSQISEAARGKKERSMEDQVDEWMNDWEAMAKGEKQSAFPTRWRAWNAKLGGITPGYHIILGPRGSGKSILAQNIACDAAFHHSLPALFVSYEMPVRMVLNRIIADMGNLHGSYLFSPDVAKPPREVAHAITTCLQRIKGSKLTVIHDVTMGLEAVAAKARSIKAQHGYCVVVVDYLQLAVDPKDKQIELREQAVAANSAILRRLSKELDIPVYALSQINKDGTSRESNAPEQDGDSVVRVERNRMPDGSMKENGLTITKNRNGDDGAVSLVLDGCCYRFKEQSISDILP
jgi:replicative DNA helicase